MQKHWWETANQGPKGYWWEIAIAEQKAKQKALCCEEKSTGWMAWLKSLLNFE